MLGGVSGNDAFDVPFVLLELGAVGASLLAFFLWRHVARWRLLQLALAIVLLGGAFGDWAWLANL